MSERSHLGRKVADGEFVTMVEIVPPRGIDAKRELEGAKFLKSVGVDAINIPDSPRASARLSNQALCLLVKQEVGIEPILHYTCRDRNVLGIQSDLLGASAVGIRNLICITGDPPKMGDYPDATAVFDVDSIGLVNIVRNLNRGLDIGGNPTGSSTAFVIAVGANQTRSRRWSRSPAASAPGMQVAAAAAADVKRVHLELGGKAPVVIFDDADLAKAAEDIAVAGYFNAGQDCTAATRVLVSPRVHDELRQRPRRAGQGNGRRARPTTRTCSTARSTMPTS